MTRLACLFVLIAMIAVTILAADPTGPTSIVFTFIGMPALVLGIGLYGIKRWREGALSLNDSTEKEAS